MLNATMAQMAATVTEPAFGTTAGEWTVFGLARGGYYAKDNAYFTDYYDRIVETVNTTAASVNLNGALHKSKSTDNSRLIVALSAIGKDATSVGDWDLVEAYSANGFSWIKKQGINGPIWALIALDSHNYETTDLTIRQQCVDAIVAAQHDDGGWSLMANKTYASDPNITGMALTALYPYRDQAAVAEACAEAIACLSSLQYDNGTFASGGAECSESCAWVIIGCTAWGINPDTDPRFIKNGSSVVDGLLAHYVEEEAMFQHIIGAGTNAMGTDQGCYGLVAYDRFVKGKAALYDYSDVTFDTAPEAEEMTAILGLPEEETTPPESEAATELPKQDDYLSDVTDSGSQVYTDGKDKYLTDPIPEGKPKPVEPEDQDVDKGKSYTCTFSIECSTILNNLDQLDPDKLEMVPSGGTILAKTTVTFYEGESVFYVLQSPENQVVTDKVWHELAFGLESLGFDTPTIRRRVAEIAAFFGIENWFYKNVTELSGGQKQLLSLASVMAMQPGVLVLDEPTAQLDPIAAADFLALLGKINRELGTTIILTEHRLEEAFPFATRVIVMNEGALLPGV